MWVNRANTLAYIKSGGKKLTHNQVLWEVKLNNLFWADTENKMYSSLRLMMEVTLGILCSRDRQARLSPAYVPTHTACHSSSRPNHCLFTHTGGLNSCELISDSTGKLLVPP